MRRYNVYILCLFILVGSVTFVYSETVVIKGINNIQDTVLYSMNTNKNFSETTELRAGMSGPNNPGIQRSLIQFNLSSIPSDAVISTVTLQMTCTRIPKNATMLSVTQEFHRVMSSWSISKNLKTVIPTWLLRSDPTLKWMKPGGDFVSTPSASCIVDKVGLVTWTGHDLIANVQGWVKQSIPNYGWILLGDEKVSRSVRGYASAEDIVNSPSLTISYTIPTIMK